MKKTIESISDKILEVFDEYEINKIAYRVGLCKRRGKLTPLTFLSICIFYSEDILTNSLTSICNTLEIHYNVDISEAGFNYKFTDEAVSFIGYFLEVLIKKKLSNNRFSDCCFTKIRIADSTTIKLPVEYYDIIGSKYKLPCRIIISKLTDENKGVKEENIYELYSLRWQVEILFKCWKSIFKINKNKNMKIQRFRCGLLGSLLSIALSNLIYNELKTEIFIEKNEVLSELKGFKLIKDYLLTVRISIEKGRRHLKLLIKTICETLKRKCKKSKRSKKMMAEEKVLLANKRTFFITNM